MLTDRIADGFQIEKGDRLWISSELMRAALIAKRTGERLDQDALIDAFCGKVGLDGTILIPTFNFDFSNKGYYDYRKTKGTVGSLGNAALRRNDFRRTLHPMHSFAVWGRDQEYLCRMTNRHAFGMDSPFEYCRKNHVKQLIIGTDYVHCLTFAHYVETVCHVPYRFAKQFTGIYVTDEGKEETRTYDYAARYLEIEPTEEMNRIGQVFEEEGIARGFEVDGIPCEQIDDLYEAFGILKDDIMNNDCRNIYDFNIPREQVFKNWRKDHSDLKKLRAADKDRTER